MKPTAHLQLAVWLEDESGRFIDTIYLTRATGALGLGNRPGSALFKSAYRWPYGRRQMVLPVWAHRRNHPYGYVVMGGKAGIDSVDDSIGYHERYSSTEPFYCSPSSLDLDAISCASAFVGSKGIYAPGMTSLYPPRGDLSVFESGFDSDDARGFASVNDLAAISSATPPGGQLLNPPVRYNVPPDLPSGQYTVWVEASLEGDFNSNHRYPAQPDKNAELRSFGREPFGQPSLVYAVPIELDGTAQTAVTDDWLGYGSWDGTTGDLHPKDATITDAPGTGAGRLLTVSDEDGTWRLKVRASACDACSTPPPVDRLTLTPSDTSIALGFDAPQAGSPLDAARRYEVRYRPENPLSDESFSEGIPAEAPPPGAPGAAQTITLSGLKAETTYHIGIRALGTCGTPSLGAFGSAHTGVQKFTVLHGCFVATAAFGTPMEREVLLLRRFRDRYLLSSPLGRLFTALYYAESPAFARFIAIDERLRRGARRLLSPAVTLAQALLLPEDSRP